MNHETDTPRTDTWECFSDPSYYDMARLRRTDGPKDFNTGYHVNNLREAVEVRDILNELERRAEKAEAKVEFWKAKAYEAEFYEGKHEAEVERLRSQLERAVEIARGFCGCGCGGDYGLCNFCADQFSELDEIKATMNPTDK